MRCEWDLFRLLHGYDPRLTHAAVENGTHPIAAVVFDMDGLMIDTDAHVVDRSAPPSFFK